MKGSRDAGSGQKRRRDDEDVEGLRSPKSPPMKPETGRLSTTFITFTMFVAKSQNE